MLNKMYNTYISTKVTAVVVNLLRILVRLITVTCTFIAFTIQTTSVSIYTCTTLTSDMEGEVVVGLKYMVLF